VTAEENSSQREIISQEPKPSTRAFVNPGVPPIKPMPSIKSVLEVATVASAPDDQSAPVPETPSDTTPPTTPVEEVPEPPAPEVHPDEQPDVPQAEEASLPDDIEYETPKDENDDYDGDDDDDDDYPSDPVVQEEESAIENDTGEEKGEDFAACWHQLFETLFSDKHLIYYSLKDETPRYEDDVIYIEVKNGIQKDLIETSKTAILEYWRNHYTLNVDDLEVTANEQKESKKVIVNSEDKLRNMAEQNDQLMDFLNILKFNIKD